MKSWQVINWGQPLELRAYENPEPTGTEVLIRITSSGICHSDLHIISGGFDLGDGRQARLEDRGVETPYTPGHEILGTVVGVGPEAEGVEVGDSRIVFPWIGCRDCGECDSGRENLCANPQFIGARVDGGYSDHVIVPHPRYLVEYGSIREELACTYACSGITAWTAHKRAGHLSSADFMLLIGLGGVGYNGFHLAPHLHNAKLIVADVDEGKREIAEQAGAYASIDPTDPNALSTLQKITGGGVRAAIDFVGAPSSFRFGMDSLAKNGTLVVVGLFGGSERLSLPMLPFMAMTIRGSYVGNLADMHDMMAVIRAGGVPEIPIETRSLAACNISLKELEAGQVTGRIVLKP